jgi:hypothetical protein
MNRLNLSRHKQPTLKAMKSHRFIYHNTQQQTYSLELINTDISIKNLLIDEDE